MKDNKPHLDDTSDLRRRAEEMLREKADQSPQDLASLLPEEILKILHELRVHQIELEIQNEELRRTQFELKTVRERYFNLYDLVPVGYVTLSEKGLILEANLTATELLGVAQGTLVKQPLSRYILKEDQDIYYLHRKQLFESGEPQGCDLRMLKKDGTPFWAHLAVTVAQDGESAPLCRALISDITERKQAEESITLVTQKTIGILESITDAFFALDENLVTTYFNTAAERLLNRNRIDVIGRNLFEAFPEAKGSVFEEKYTRAIREKKMLTFETYFGEKPYENWYEVRVYPQQDGISIFFQVVTERKQAEVDLRESKEAALRSEARLKKAQTVARVGDWVWNIKDGQVEWSDEMYTIFGIDKNSYTGRLGEVVAQVIHPDDLHLVLPSNAATFAEKKPVEYRIIWPDGSIRHIWAESGDAILDKSGNPIFLTGIAQDITERKLAETALSKSEQSFRALAENSGDYIMRYDHEHRHVYANPRAIQVSGLTAAEFIGKTHREMGFPEDLCALWETAINQVFATGQSYREVFKWESAEGLIALDWRVFPEMDAQGRVIFVLGVSRDITEQKLAEENIRKINRHYQALIEKAPDGITLLDAEGNIKYVSPTTKKLFGFSPADQIGGSGSRFTHPDDLPQVLPELGRLMADPAYVPTLQYRYADKNGNWRWLESTFTNLLADPSVESIVINSRDITERKQAEEELRASEHKFRQTFDVSPVGIVRVGLDTRFIQCNLAFAQSLGYDPEELVGKRIADVTLPEDSQIGKAEMAAILKGEIAKSQVQKRYLRKDGQVIWGEVTISLIRDSNGHAQYFLAIIQNITERKLAEEKLIISEQHFRSLFEQAASGVAITDAYSGKFLKINQAFCEILGYTPEEMQDVEFKTLTHPDDVQISLQKMNLLLTGAIGKFSMEKRYIRKNGSVVWVDLSAASMWEPGDSPTNYVSIIQDITPRKKIEQALRESEERYHLIDEASQDLIYSYDRQSRFTHANSSLCKLMGLKPEQIIGRTHEELGFPQEQCDEWARLHHQVFETNSTVISETITPIQGGEPLYFEVVLNPIHDNSGAIIGIAGTTRDINARKQAEEKISEQLNELRRWHNATLGREDRIMELKREVNKLLAETGKPPHYASVAEAKHE